MAAVVEVLKGGWMDGWMDKKEIERWIEKEMTMNAGGALKWSNREWMTAENKFIIYPLALLLWINDKSHRMTKPSGEVMGQGWRWTDMTWTALVQDLERCISVAAVELWNYLLNYHVLSVSLVQWYGQFVRIVQNFTIFVSRFARSMVLAQTSREKKTR